MKKVISILISASLLVGIIPFNVQAIDLNNVDVSDKSEQRNSKNEEMSIKERIKSSFRENKEKKNYKENELLVKFKNVNNILMIKPLEEKYELIIEKFSSNKVSVITFDSNKHSLEEMLEKLNNDFYVEYAEPNYSVKVKGTPVEEPYYNSQWSLKNTITKGLDINIEPVWKTLTGSPKVIVGVIDSGVDYNHKDLKDNIWTNTIEIPNNGIDDDKNGYIDDYVGWDFVNGDNSPEDDNGHGTHVSGIIAAENNGTGIVGVSPDVKVMALKAGDKEGKIYTDSAIEAIEYGVKKGVKIFNLSYGGNDYSQSEYETMKNANALFICAAGNEISNNDLIQHYPSNYNIPNIITVASFDRMGKLSYFSNYGQNTVDIAAPGSDIYSTLPKNAYGFMGGTSMAAPHVSGVAALLLSYNPELTPLKIKSYILNGAGTLAALNDKVDGGRILDSEKVISQLTAANNIPVSGIDINTNAISLKMGQVSSFIATPKPQEATIKDVFWESSNNSIAKVDQNGKVIGVAPGTATIKVTTVDGGFSVSAKVTVTSDSELISKNGKWYFYKNGIPQVGWQLINGVWHFFNTDGVMKTGWLYWGNKWYFLANNGEMSTGWLSLNGKWYYLEVTGTMKIGWLNQGGTWYYLDGNGVMKTGWLSLGGVWYYLQPSGDMVTGWLYNGGYWYYLNPSGSMKTGWINSGGKWYYLYGSGRMAVSTTVSGYKIGKDGAWIY